MKCREKSVLISHKNGNSLSAGREVDGECLGYCKNKHRWNFIDKRNHSKYNRVVFLCTKSYKVEIKLEK